MTNLEKLELKNFQTHEDLVLEFTEGISVVFGPTDCGKSSIRRAIEFLCDINVCSGLRKEGTKQTSVKGWFSNGAVVTRVKSASINRYILEQDGKEQTFDAIGKSAPAEIKEAIGIYPLEVDGDQIYLNSVPQISLPFLLDKSGTFRMKLFNQLTGNDVLDKLFVSFNKDILRFKRTLKEGNEKLPELATELEKKECEKEQLEFKYKKTQKLVGQIKDQQTELDNLLKTKELYSSLLAKLNETNHKLNELNIPQDIDFKGLTEKIEGCDTLKTLSNALESLQTQIKTVDTKIGEIVYPELNVDEIEDKIKTLDILNDLCYNLDKNLESGKLTDKKIEKVVIELNEGKAEYKTKLFEAKECPTCGGVMTEECLQGIKL